MVNQLKNSEKGTVITLNPTIRDIPEDELFYGNREWGFGQKRTFFTVNQSFDFMNGTDWEEPEEEYNVLTEF